MARFGPVELDLDRHLGFQVARRLAERLAVDVDLLVGRGVHEVVVVAVLVEVLHFALVERRAVHRILRPQFLIGQRAAPDVAELHADEAAQVARRHVLQLQHAKQIVLDLDEHALLQTRCLYRSHVPLV